MNMKVSPSQLAGIVFLFTISCTMLQAHEISISASTAMKQDTTPPATHVDTVAVPAVAAPPAEKPEKEKKEGYNSKTRFGIRAGGLISKQDYENSMLTEDPTSKIGGDLGIVVTIPIIGGFFAVQPELHWEQKGYKATTITTGEQTTTHLDYFEIPVLARFNFGGSIRIFAFGGPSFGWLINGSNDPDNGEDPTDKLDDTELSGHVGLGIGIGTFEFDLRYIAGLNDISSTEEFKNAKNSSFGAGITLKF